MERRASSPVQSAPALSCSRGEEDGSALGGRGRPSLHRTSRPKRPIQRSVLNLLSNVPRFKLRNSVQVGDRACDFQDAVMGARAEPLLRHGAFQQALTIGGKLTGFTNGLRRHLCVAVEFLALGRKARQLRHSRVRSL
jgi:hypothetical protein